MSGASLRFPVFLYKMPKIGGCSNCNVYQPQRLVCYYHLDLLVTLATQATTANLVNFPTPANLATNIRPVLHTGQAEVFQRYCEGPLTIKMEVNASQRPYLWDKIWKTKVK